MDSYQFDTADINGDFIVLLRGASRHIIRRDRIDCISTGYRLNFYVVWVGVVVSIILAGLMRAGIMDQPTIILMVVFVIIMWCYIAYRSFVSRITITVGALTFYSTQCGDYQLLSNWFSNHE